MDIYIKLGRNYFSGLVVLESSFRVLSNTLTFSRHVIPPSGSQHTYPDSSLDASEKGQYEYIIRKVTAICHPNPLVVKCDINAGLLG